MRGRWLAVVLLSLASLGGDCKKGPGPAPKPPKATLETSGAGATIAMQHPPVALLATHGTVTRLYHVTGADLGEPVTAFAHVEGGDVRAALLPDGTVAATARYLPLRDRSFDSALWHLTDTPKLICDGVAHASTPLALPDGSVVVARGEAGVPRSEALRLDTLFIDRFDTASKSVRLHTYTGYLVHLAGWSGDEIVVYRVGEDGADIVGLDPDTGGVRVIVPRLPAFARDFSIDEGVLIFRGRDAESAHVFTVERVDLATLRRERLYESPDFAIAPHAWPGGHVAINNGGLMLLGADQAWAAPMGDGVDLVAALSSDRRWVAARHTAAGKLAVPFVMHVESGASLALPAPEGARVAIAGFLEGSP